MSRAATGSIVEPLDDIMIDDATAMYTAMTDKSFRPAGFACKGFMQQTPSYLLVLVLDDCAVRSAVIMATV
jgi:hypothetical protein